MMRTTPTKDKKTISSPESADSQVPNRLPVKKQPKELNNSKKRKMIKNGINTHSLKRSPWLMWMTRSPKM